MKKGITKDQVINKALELMRDKEDIRSVNLRVIAREVGCAHTNLYNYFSSFDELLRESYIKVLNIFSNVITKSISDIEDNQLKIKTIFNEVVNFYLDNKGWFRLLWVEIIERDEKEANYIAATQTVDGLVIIIEDICKHLYSSTPSQDQIKNILHVAQCYIYGEVSIYIANHSFVQYQTQMPQGLKLIPFANGSLIKDELSFRKYVVEEAIKIFYLYLNREG
jgi:AcrR family transcriptional regulator